MTRRARATAPEARAGLLAALGTFAAALATVATFYPGERPDVAPAYERYSSAILDGQVPYRDFFVEYPPGALLSFALPGLLPDRWYGLGFEIIAAAALGASAGIAVAALARAGERRRLGLLCVLFVLAVGPVAVTRYDAVVALAVTVAAALAVRRRAVGAAAALGLGAAMKLYPAALVPPLARVAPGRSGRVVVVAAAVALAVALPFLVAGPGGVRASVEYQLERPLQLESLGGSALLLGDALGAREATITFEAGSQSLTGALARVVSVLQLAVLGTLLAVVLLRFTRRPRPPEQLVSVAAAVLALLVALGSVLSPQFLVWLFPLALLALAPRRLGLAALLVACALTQVIYPNRYDELVAAETLPALLLLLRNACLLAVAAVLAWPWLRAGPHPAAGTA